MKLKIVKLSEVSQLEPLVISCIDQVEEGLKVLDNQISIGDFGRPDVIACDKNGTFVILELKSVTADYKCVSQGIRYYEWFIQNLALASKPYPSIKVGQGVRLIFIAPEFEGDTIRLVKYLSDKLDITLVKYTGLQEEQTKELGIAFETLDLEPTVEPQVTFRSVEDITDYIIIEGVQNEFISLLESLKTQDIVIKPYNAGKHYWVECLFNGEPIGYFQPRQRYFNCQIYDPQTEEFIWPPIRLTTVKQWKKECKSFFDDQMK